MNMFNSKISYEIIYKIYIIKYYNIYRSISIFSGLFFKSYITDHIE